MGDIWLISDTHFNHTNILKFVDNTTGDLVRPGFNDTEDMDQHMVDCWNSVVKHGDKIYHLGDVVLGQHEEEWMKTNWPKLNGKKNLILGNHDNYKMLARGGFFSNIYESRDLREFGLLLTHRPAHDSQLWDFTNNRPMKSCHGHIHQRHSPSANHINLSVELINYTPVNIEDLRIYS